MFICPATVSAQAFVFAIAISLFTVTLSASFPYPQMLHSVSASLPFALFFSAPLLSTIHPLLPFSIFPIIPLFPPSHRPPLSRSPSSPSLPFLLRTDLLSLHWWPWWFSWMVHSLPVPLQGLSLQPAHAAALSGDSSLSSFSVGIMTAWHLLLSPVTSWYYHIGHREICDLMYALFN